MKNLDIRNKIFTFAAFPTRTNLHNANRGSYFCGYLNAIICKDMRLSTHDGLLRLRCNLFLSERGAIAFFIFYTLIFHYMTRTMKDASSVKNSSTQARQRGAKSVSIEAFNIEKNAKNSAYHFILSHSLFDLFSDYCKNVSVKDPHAACVSILAAQVIADEQKSKTV